MKAVLIIKKGFNSGAVYRLGEKGVTLGRDPGNLIQIIDSGVSRRHCLLELRGRDYFILDLLSHNGTTVNGRKLVEAQLNYGDRIQVGGTVLEFNMDEGVKKDSSMEPKVMDRRFSASPTQTMEKISVVPVVIKGKSVNDTDKLHLLKEQRVMLFLSELNKLISSQVESEKLMKKIEEGIFEFINPDRLFVLRIGEENRLKTSLSRMRDGLTESEKTTKPEILMVSRCVNERSSLFINAFSYEKDDYEGIGSAAAVPFLSGAQEMEQQMLKGLIYVDSFKKSRQFFLAEDVQFLEKVSGLLGRIL
ncbi:MAG: FHA domain-containing protein [Deltaproteobacteria bacterium]|nr:FHA domain-containing protein [Deltaproteobacteria bacterium]